MDRLESDVPVIVPSPAAAEILRSAANARAAAAGLRVWEPRTPHIWESWTLSLWNDLLLQGCESRTVLNGLQERALWTAAIAANHGRTPLSAEPNLQQDLAALAASAFGLAEAARLPQPLRAYTEDTRAFAAWSEAFRARCERQQVIPAASLDAALLAHLAAGSFPHLPAEIDVAGFAGLTASRLELLEGLREAGTAVRVYPVRAESSESSAMVCTSLPDPGVELRFVASEIDAFVRPRLEAGLTSRVAVVLPNPMNERAEIDAVFREALAPELADLELAAELAPWSFAAGPVLATQPAAREALDLLRGLLEPLPLERASALLLAASLGDPAHRYARARLDVTVLRRHPRLRPELDLAALLKLLGAPPRPGKPPLSSGVLRWMREPLQLYAARQADPHRTRSYAAWGELVRALLAAAGWQPQDQIRDTWDRTLDQLATLDMLNERVTFSAFLRALEGASESARLPQAAADPALEIRVLTLPETEGACFDAAFVLRSTERLLGAPPRPHPLLPWELQHSHRIPGANAAADAERTRAQLGALLATIPKVLFTSAQQDADGPLRASPLPDELGCHPIDPPPAVAAPPPLALEAVLDDLPRPQPSAESQSPQGARVLQLQAACPFRAFAELRLGTAPLDRPELGLDARDTGNLLHRSMERFWLEHETRERLAQLSEEERAASVRHAVAETFASLRRRPGVLDPAAEAAAWDDAYLNLEQKRLEALACEWLHKELERADFRVETPEEREPIQVGPLLLTMRPDRRDVTAEGGVVIVDYKTGATVGPKAWEGERPDEPQLPLYALTAEAEPERLVGITLARIRAGDGAMCWDGLQAEENVLPGNKKIVNLPERLAEWRITLDRLAWEFFAGGAPVDPKDPGVTCRHCGQRMLCRLNPDAPPGDEAEEGAVDG